MRVAICSDTETVATGLDRLLAPFRLERLVRVRGSRCFALVDGDHLVADVRSGQFLAFRDCKVLGMGTEWGRPVSQLLASLNRTAIEETNLFALHAGVVAINGFAIAFPKNSGGGKSTLTAACLREGFAYVSDEALCVDPESGLVVPYPKPLGLSAWSRNTLMVPDRDLAFPSGDAEALVTPSDLGAGMAAAKLPLAHVVLALYGHETASLRKTTASEVMAALLQYSFNHYKHGERAFRLAAHLANQATGWRLEYGDPSDAARLLKGAFGNS